MDFNSGKSSQKRPVAIILGVSRGIGKALAQALFATHDLILASKSIAEIQTLANQLQQQPTNHTHSASRKSALAVQCDVRSSKDIEIVFAAATASFPSQTLDLIVLNAGAIFHASLADTTEKKFILLHEVNAKAAFSTIKQSISTKFKGLFIAVCPPIYSRFIRGKTAYAVSKYSASMMVLGAAMEPHDFTICGLWPATAIQSAATDKVPNHLLRTPEVFCDAVKELYQQSTTEKKMPGISSSIDGELLIDEDYLRSRGFIEFDKYALVKDRNVPRMMPAKFPNLKVAEHDQIGFSVNKSSRL